MPPPPDYAHTYYKLLKIAWNKSCKTSDVEVAASHRSRDPADCTYASHQILMYDGAITSQHHAVTLLAADHSIKPPVDDDDEHAGPRKWAYSTNNDNNRPNCQFIVLVWRKNY